MFKNLKLLKLHVFKTWKAQADFILIKIKFATWIIKRIRAIPFILLLLLLSSVICFFFNSWVTIWVMLELNTLAYCCIIKSFSIEKKFTTEIRIKYFIIQSVSSSMLVFSRMCYNISYWIFAPLAFIRIISLTIKIASSPFHQWFVSMVKKTIWKNRTLLITWQKLAPLFLVIYQIKRMLYPFIIMSVVVGRVSQINKRNLIEIIAFSSVFNLRWIMMAISINRKLLILFSILYWSSVLLIMIIISKSKINKVNRESLEIRKKWFYFIVAINLAGIPPLAGFLAKWMVLREVLKFNLIIIITLFLVIRRINLYIYLRFINLIVTKNFLKKQKIVKKTKKLLTLLISTVNIYPLAIISWYRTRLKKGLFW